VTKMKGELDADNKDAGNKRTQNERIEARVSRGKLHRIWSGSLDLERHFALAKYRKKERKHAQCVQESERFVSV
jgi:hypothetical protein